MTVNVRKGVYLMKKNMLKRLVAMTAMAVMMVTSLPLEIQAKEGVRTETRAEAAVGEEALSHQLPSEGLKPLKEGADQVLPILERKTSGKGAARYANPKASTAREWESYVSRYYYQYLSTGQREIYDYLYATLTRYLTDPKLDAMQVGGGYYSQWYLKNCNRQDLRIAFYTFLYENPQFFFVDYTNCMMGKNSLIISIFESYAKGAARESAAQQIKVKISGYVSAASAATTAYEKEKIVHDRLIAEVSYVENDYDQSIASTFLLNQTVCSGYAQGFAAIMNSIGVPTICVLSDTHAWNEILLGGKWYVVDCTWDDDLSDTEYKDFYLNVSESRVLRVDEYMAKRKQDPKEKTIHVPMAMYKKLHRPKAMSNFDPKTDTSRFSQIYGMNLVNQAPAKPSVFSLKSKGKGRIVITAKKSGFIDGYQIRLIRGSSVTLLAATSSGNLKKEVRSLKRKHTYKVQIRSFRYYNSKRKYSPWTGKKAIRVA